jgi:hypothetical protein
MDKPTKDPIFKKGIWIKEQQGVLTIGSLDQEKKETMVIPDTLSSKIFAFEQEVLDALYGNDSQPFNPEIVDIEKLLAKIKSKFKNKNIRIAFSNPQREEFRGDHDEIFSLLEKLVLSSLPAETEAPPLIYINASILQDHLCIIYRDAASISDPSTLEKEIRYIQNTLKGEISYKKTSETRSYYDIMIPSKK